MCLALGENARTSALSPHLHEVFSCTLFLTHGRRVWDMSAVQEKLFLLILRPRKGPRASYIPSIQRIRPVAFNHTEDNPPPWQFPLFSLQPVLPGTRSVNVTLFHFPPLRHLTNFYQSHQDTQQHSPNYVISQLWKFQKIYKSIKKIQPLPSTNLL